MRPCPSCGEYSRVEVAPHFFECTARKKPEAADPPETAGICGAHYIDTSDTRGDSSTSSPARLLRRLITGD